MKMKWVMPCQPVGPEARPGHGPVAFKRVVPGRRPIGPYYVGPTRSPDIRNLFIVPINLVMLIKNYLMLLNLN
jgi:hypothetical protein